MEKLYSVELSYAVFGIITDEKDIVVRTAPISRKSLGKHINDVIIFYEIKRKGYVTYLGEI